MRQVGLALALLLLAGTTAAEESPAKRFRKLVEGFGAPSKKGAFEFEGHMCINDVPVATVVLSAHPDGEGNWLLVDRLDTQVGDWRQSEEDSWVITPDFRLLRSTRTTVTNGRRSRIECERKQNRFRLSTSGNGEGAKATTSTVRAAANTSVLGPAAALLLARLARRKSVTLELTDFTPSPKPGKPHLRSRTIECVAKAPWRGHGAFLLRTSGGGRDWEFAFSPGDRKFLGAKAVDPDQRVFTILPGERPPTPRLDVSPPAETPEKAACIAMLAIYLGDAALLDRVADWPSMARRLMLRDGTAIPEDSFREAMMSGITKFPRTKDRELMIAKLLMASRQFKVHRDGEGKARVVFPPAFKSASLSLEKKGDAWYLVEFPDNW